MSLGEFRAKMWQRSCCPNCKRIRKFADDRIFFPRRLTSIFSLSAPNFKEVVRRQTDRSVQSLKKAPQFWIILPIVTFQPLIKGQSKKCSQELKTCIMDLTDKKEVTCELSSACLKVNLPRGRFNIPYRSMQSLKHARIETFIFDKVDNFSIWRLFHFPIEVLQGACHPTRFGYQTIKEGDMVCNL